MARNLPDGYTSRCEAQYDIPGSAPAERLQQVYEFARYLSERGAIDRIIAIGSTSIAGLKALDLALPAVCIDHPSNRDFVTTNLPTAGFLEWDPQTSLPAVPSSPLAKTLILCADLIGRLERPEVLLRELAGLSLQCAYIIITTADRARGRGFMDNGPPPEPAYTMDWTADEFARFMLACGFKKNFLIGYTFSGGLDSPKNTILAIAGREATFSPPHAVRTVTAIMHAYNEEDVVASVAQHLKTEGVQLHLIDNWSTDRTYEIAQALVNDGLCERVTRFPESPPDDFDLSSLVAHVAEYAAKIDSDWIIYLDADEFRSAPWPQANLAEAITFVDGLGYAAIDFTIANFYLTSNSHDQAFSPDSCKFFEFGRHPAHFLQVKAWKNQGRVVDLVSTGAHLAQFPDGPVYPLKFLNRHYTLRSAEQASRKILHDRVPRTERERRQRGWHDHYDEFRGATRVELWRRHELLYFDPNMFNADYLIERLSGIGIEEDRRGAISVAQWRTALADSQSKLDQAIRETEQLKTERSRLAASLAAMQNSISWRVTRPLRRLRLLHRRFFGGSP
jgi:glycosyltransferase involved in cell wall biosynthesis